MAKLKNKYVISAAIVLVVIIGIVAFKHNGDGQNLVTVARKDVIQEVVVTGKTKAQAEADLAFDASGRIAHSYAEVGTKVYQGQILAELDISSDLANLAKEKAALAEEQNKLGSEGERVESSIREAYAAADNAVRNKIDQFFKTPRDNPRFEVKFTDGNFIHYFNVPTDTAVDLNNTRKSIEETLVKWQAELVSVNAQNAKNYSNSAIVRMNAVSDFLDKVAYAVNSFTPAEFAYDSTVTGYKTAVDAARSAVSNARQNLINADSAGSERVSQMQSSVDSLEVSLNKSRIIAPFNGTVTRADAKVGEVATPQQSLITLISENDLYVEANVSEVNIGKVKVGNRVSVEFDAYPGTSFSGTVTFIDPGESIVDKVVNYKIRIKLDPANSLALKSGLTANVKIATASSTQALAVPVYATFKEGDKTFVNKLIDDKPVKTEVELGLQGSDGSAEVLSGLSEGDSIEYTK